MFSNEVRINHIKQLYLYLLKYDGFGVYSVRELDGAYTVTLSRMDATYGTVPLHVNLTLSPVPEEE